MPEEYRHYHKPCLRTFKKERERAEFAEARLRNLEQDIRYLALKMDGISGHEVHETLGRKTMGGAVRGLILND
jgi:hypothetical protein